MVCGAELGDDHVDLITFSWISVSLIQSRGGLPSHKQSEIFDSAVPKPKVLFCFCFVFLVSLLVAFGWPRQGGAVLSSQFEAVLTGMEPEAPASTGSTSPPLVLSRPVDSGAL